MSSPHSGAGAGIGSTTRRRHIGHDSSTNRRPGGMANTSSRTSRLARTGALGLLSALAVLAVPVSANAKGGTAKPPQGAILPAALLTPTLQDPAFSVDP